MIFSNQKIGSQGEVYNKKNKFQRYDYLITFIGLLMIYILLESQLLKENDYLNAIGIGILGGFILVGLLIAWLKTTKNSKNKRKK